jgi:hypothetical protein
VHRDVLRFQLRLHLGLHFLEVTDFIEGCQFAGQGVVLGQVETKGWGLLQFFARCC